MRVAIEAAPLALSSGGLTRYTAELSLALARCYPEDEYYLISDQRFELPAGAAANLKRGGGPRNAAERRWWLFGLNREMDRLGVGLFHGPDFSVPYIPRRPSVMTLHDLSPWMDPSWHSNADRVAGRTPLLLDFGIATMVLTPTAMVRKMAIERFRLSPERVVVTPEAAPAWLRPVECTPPRPYFLYLGTLEPRKNLSDLVHAWRDVRRQWDVDLVLAGRRRADFAAIPPEPGLRLAGEVDDRELAALYSGAVAFVYPSHYEGFGLPALEAMQCGACVIASRAIEGWAGEAACYGESPRELSEFMARAIREPGWRAERRARSLERSREFSWERTARLTREAYEEACKRFER